MKSNSKPLALVIFLATIGLVVGCQSQYPSKYLSSTGPNSAMIIDFESGLTVNPNLAEVNRPNNTVPTPGTIVATGNPLVTPLIVTPGAPNSNHCVHMAGSVTGDSSYPAIMLVIPLDASGTTQYDASLFTGIKFYIKTSSADNAVRSFAIPVVKTTVAPAGTCAQYNSCYNNFAYTYPNTNGNWQLVSLPFNTMARQSYGGAISPTTLSGTNLQQILSLQWSEGNQNVPTAVNVDFYVDEVQFF